MDEKTPKPISPHALVQLVILASFFTKILELNDNLPEKCHTEVETGVKLLVSDEPALVEVVIFPEEGSVCHV